MQRERCAMRLFTLRINIARRSPGLEQSSAYAVDHFCVASLGLLYLFMSIGCPCRTPYSGLARAIEACLSHVSSGVQMSGLPCGRPALCSHTLFSVSCCLIVCLVLLQEDALLGNGAGRSGLNVSGVTSRRRRYYYG